MTTLLTVPKDSKTVGSPRVRAFKMAVASQNWFESGTVRHLDYGMQEMARPILGLHAKQKPPGNACSPFCPLGIKEGKARDCF